MSIAFGSVGDIIAVVLLIKDLVNALNDCKGSAYHFQRLCEQLRVLEQALLQVNQLVQKHESSIELNALCVAADQAARACRGSTEHFLKRIKAYHNSLKQYGSGNILKDVARKIQWNVLRKEEVDRFYAEMVAHTQSLNLLLMTWGINTIEMHGSKTHQALAAAEEVRKASDQTQEGLLNLILTRVNNAVSISEDTSNILQQTVSISRIRWLQQLGSKLMDMMTNIQTSTLNICANVRSLNDRMSELCSQVLLMEAPIVLIDSHGRRMPMHLQFINSWEAFDAVMEVRFRGSRGHRKIMNKEYALADSKSGLDVERHRPWDSCFTPRQQVNMDMMFQSAELKMSSRTVCLRCSYDSHLSQTLADAFESQCPACGFVCKTVTVAVDAIPTTRARQDNPMSTGPMQTRKRSVQFEEDLDQPKHFKRVRLLSQIMRKESSSQTARRKSRFKELSSDSKAEEVISSRDSHNPSLPPAQKLTFAPPPSVHSREASIPREILKLHRGRFNPSPPPGYSALDAGPGSEHNSPFTQRTNLQHLNNGHDPSLPPARNSTFAPPPIVHSREVSISHLKPERRAPLPSILQPHHAPRLSLLQPQMMPSGLSSRAEPDPSYAPREYSSYAARDPPQPQALRAPDPTEAERPSDVRL
ncbi:MAG: hypothetical protein Q9159_005916 [Coniocarpon cinnabarinum]